MAGKDDVSDQRAVLTKDIKRLGQRFRDFKDLQWEFFPQTKNFHADMFMKRIDNLALVCESVVAAWKNGTFALAFVFFHLIAIMFEKYLFLYGRSSIGYQISKCPFTTPKNTCT